MLTELQIQIEECSWTISGNKSYASAPCRQERSSVVVVPETAWTVIRMVHTLNSKYQTFNDSSGCDLDSLYHDLSISGSKH